MSPKSSSTASSSAPRARQPRSAAIEEARRRPNLDRALALVLELMAIPGKSCEEADVAAAITAHLKAAGLSASRLKSDTAHRQTPTPGNCGNLVLKLPGTLRAAPRRMLSAHLDTVPICVGSQPVRKGRLIRSAAPDTGLGADNRAGCAVLLNTALEILEHQLPHPPLTFCWFVQEEIGLHGVQAANRKLWGEPQLAFNWDGGSASKLTVGATGAYRIRIQIDGIASHAGGAPEQGVSAIAIASLAIADLQQRGWHGDVHQDGCHGTSNVGVIEGGKATNVVTDRVFLRAEARSHDRKFRKRILSEIEAAFRRAAKQVCNAAGKTGRVHIESHLDYESFLLGNDEPCVLAAEQAVRAVGREPERAVANGGLDANWITAFGLPAVSLGCGQLHQHMTSEALDIAEFEEACRIGLAIATATDT